MSMENAILELAAAIRELAGSGVRMAGLSKAFAAPYGVVTEVNAEVQAGKSVKASMGDAEVEQAVRKVEAAAKEEKKTAPKAAPKEEQPAPADEPAAEEEEPVAGLDYKADVYPKLVALAKAKGKPVLVGLLQEFEAANGDQLKPEQYAAVLARAAKLAA